MVQSDSDFQTEKHSDIHPDFSKGKGLIPVITQ